MTLSVGVLVSGRGTNLQAILDACATGRVDARVVLVASSRADAPALERAARADVPHAVFDTTEYAGREPAQLAIADALVRAGVRLVVLAGFDRILCDAFFERLGPIPVINIHPALLPRFGGRGMVGSKVHEAVLASGDRESGATVHRASRGMVDEGEIVVQRRVPVMPGDTPESVAARVLEQEHVAIVEAIGRFAEEASAARRRSR